ncbi:MAG: hypothetical protein HKN85_12405 [Gammaproteobacteria bacterium]|nr:hypothetical protein [Gammaproteobacteria bacterium]
MEGPIDANRRKLNLKNRIDPTVEQAVLEYAIEEPAHGQVSTDKIH